MLKGMGHLRASVRTLVPHQPLTKWISGCPENTYGEGWRSIPTTDISTLQQIQPFSTLIFYGFREQRCYMYK